MRAVLIGAAILIAGVTGAAAKDTVNCAEAQAQQDMNICAQMDYEKADAELNAVWKDALAAAKALDAEEPDASRRGAAAALLAAQRGWIAYRDGTCTLAGWEAHGGSMEPMLVSGCLATTTQARTKELRDFIAGPDQ